MFTNTINREIERLTRWAEDTLKRAELLKDIDYGRYEYLLQQYDGFVEEIAELREQLNGSGYEDWEKEYERICW